MLEILLATTIAQVHFQKPWAMLSEDGKLFVNGGFCNSHFSLPDWKKSSGDYVYYVAGRQFAMTATTSQYSHLYSRLGSHGRHPDVFAHAALSATIWGVCFREYNLNISDPPKGTTNTSLWVAIVDSKKRGMRPNVGMRADVNFLTANLQFLSRDRLALTGLQVVRRAEGERYPLVECSSYVLVPKMNLISMIWSRKLKGVREFDSSGVIFEQNGKWQFMRGESGKVTALPENREPEDFAMFKVFYRDATGTTVHNLRTGKKLHIDGFFVRLVSSAGAYMLGDKGQKESVAIRVPSI